MVGGVECAGYPGLRDAHGVQHHVGPQPVRRVPDVVQCPGSGVAPVITRIRIYSSTSLYMSPTFSSSSYLYLDMSVLYHPTELSKQQQ